ncbi:hypothetical protein ACFY3V_00540 [Streptosporangium sp. NPDC000095]|uniref:hypothetical protein n=2 Tax=unclassified Streptosporangium TaxID=2632669 RepID=UPI0036BE0487
MTLTNPDRPNAVSSSGPGGPPRRIPRPMVIATAVVLVASGGVGASPASAASPPPAPTESPTPTPSVTVSETPPLSPTPIPPPSTETPTPTPTPTTTTPPRVPPVAFPGTLHGEFVLPAKDGCGFTVFAQTGEATALAEDSITVKSQDGFERVYTIADTTKSLSGRRDNVLRQGDWVSVTATTSGETATAAYVFGLTRPHKKFWRGGGWWSINEWRPGSRWHKPAICPTPPVATPTPPVETPLPPTPPPTDTPFPPTESPLPPTETPPPTEEPPPAPTPEPTPTVTEGTPTPTPTPTP